MRLLIVICLLLCFSASILAQYETAQQSSRLLNSAVGNPYPANTFLSNPDFWQATSANLAGTGLFLARIYSPKSAKWFGYTTQALGIPALALTTVDLINHTSDFSTWSNLSYAAWALFAVTVDHIMKMEYRNPFKHIIIVPYVASYFIGIGSMSAAQINNGYLPWGIAGVTCIINVGSSFYSRSKGGDR